MKRFVHKATPLYISVRSAILEAIESGDIAQDGRLPSEDTLANYFSVSRPTVRSALQLLENDGIINKRHGSETVINKACLSSKMRIDEAQGYWKLIENGGMTPGILSSSFNPAVIPAPIAKKLDIEDGSNGYLLQKVYTANKNPVILVKEYIPGDQFYRIPSENESNDFPLDIFTLSRNYFQQPISYSILEISSMKPNPEIIKALLFSSDTSLVRLEETHFNEQNKPAAFSEVIIRDSIIRVQVVRKSFF